jgi:hypothetical protein
MYAAILLGETLYFYPLWDSTPHATEIGKGTWDNKILEFQYTSDILPGNYYFYAAIAEHGTYDVLGLNSVTVALK